MLKKISPLIILLLLVCVVWFLFFSTMPRNVEKADVPETEFSTLRAFGHVNSMAQAPHYLGSNSHSLVRNYIVNELQNMGLEVQTQEGYSLDNSGVIALSKNILARIPGNQKNGGKDLLLMSHYDSAGHSSFGASDAASGIGVILEAVRAMLAAGDPHENDIILLFTDGEEIGLLGARLFVEKHPWARNVGLALNFEARGSGGNSFMLLETNKGNSGLIKEFIKANPRFPVTNSLAYSVYKMLPNDTDLTVLREEGNINGFNFAFIDDHYDYHTANDIPENLDMETLAHQGSYLVPLLNYFKNANLSSLESNEDLIYFSIPGGKIVTYPFAWILPILILAFIFFLVVTGYGVYRKRFNYKAIFQGSLAFLGSLFGSAILVFLLWQFGFMIYAEYPEMEHGFTYNGYWYIAAAIFLSLCINFMVYHKFRIAGKQTEFFVFPLFFWLFLCLLTAVFLKGAAYFIIPALFAILQLGLMLRYRRPNLFLMFFLSLPALVILLPFIPIFPVALGLKILFVAAILTTLLFSLFLPVFGYFTQKKALGLFCFLIFNILFITAHFKSSFNENRPKPNSLVYILDNDTQKASWNSYDKMIDDWTKPFFGKDPLQVKEHEAGFSSKYRSNFNYKAEAPTIPLARPGILFNQIEETDSLGFARYSLKIAPNRRINRMELFADRNVNFQEFRVNNLEAGEVNLGKQAFHIFTKRWQERLLIYHATNRDTLRLEFVVAPEELPEFTLYEASYDLLDNPELNVPPREKTMIPRPFVLNDAVIVKQTLRLP
ncbi:M28 family peptidase [Antarcticibacterium arcticum]|uniref:Vacuolar membrane protease n=1 Tax=Antarcticibacterium arcticum TaxID=2585771 RepID=A0A5B8YPY0_9FLAO|nr:M28 family peptidase [Antarcticibacterium arcticum]QED38703.1 M28 family peptidase [Antarcticibacterium arcticum]